MNDPSPSGIKDEVERSSQGEEEDEVECFVRLTRNVWLRRRGCGGKRGIWKQTDRGREEQEDHEGDWFGTVSMLAC